MAQKIIRGDKCPWPRDWYQEGWIAAYMADPPHYTHPDYLKGYCDRLHRFAQSAEGKIDWITIRPGKFGATT